jgi:terminal uridylyltransferase
VLPNLQRIPPARTLSQEEVLLNGHNIYFYDDVATLRQEWASQNTENVGELLIDFFRYFSKEFTYSRDVISLRTEGGLMSKDNETWTAEVRVRRQLHEIESAADALTLSPALHRGPVPARLQCLPHRHEGRPLHGEPCVSDLWLACADTAQIRGEFMRAARILTSKADHVARALAELCEEREDGLSRAPDFPSRSRGGSVPGHSGAADARLMRDLYYRETPRRYDAPGASMFGGSFAFEEMARGLGQAQGGQRVAMARPTAAMLAPLSQNNGLSPRVGRAARVASRFEPPGRSSRSAQPQAGFSARSEDGSGANGYDAHLRASPQGLRPHELPGTSTAEHPTSLDAHLAVPDSSQPLNRSLSLQHGKEGVSPALDIPKGKQRVQLPLRSEPGSPSLGSPAPYGDFDAIAALNGMTLDVSGRAGPRSTSGCSSSGAGGRASPLPPLPPSSDVGASTFLASRHAGWSFLQPALRAGGGAGRPSDARSFGGESASGHSYAPLEDDDEGGEVHDDSSSISEGTLDELARVSALQDIDDRHDDVDDRASPALMPPGAASRIRSWARTSSAPRVEGFDGGMVPPSPDLEQHLEDVEPELEDDEEEVDVRSARGLAHLRAEELATPTKATR